MSLRHDMEGESIRLLYMVIFLRDGKEALSDPLVYVSQTLLRIRNKTRDKRRVTLKREISLAASKLESSPRHHLGYSRMPIVIESDLMILQSVST